MALLFFNNCSSLINDKIEFERRLVRSSSKYILDKSLAVNDIVLDQEKSIVTVKGRTTSSELHTDLKTFSDSLSFKYEVVLLPDPSLGDSIHGIVNVSVAPMRDRSSHTAQMVDQAIMGNMVKILYENEDWYLCQTHYDYVGWITKSAVHQCNTDLLLHWEKNAKYRIKTLNAIIYSQPNKSSTPVSDGVLNNRLNISENLSEWYEVTLPDGRVGFIDKKNVELINNDRYNEDQNEHIISTALSMKGIPYLWGGNSSKGNDCSGYTQTVFKSAGIQLPRDARQQAQIGKPVKKENLKKGDLLFFGSGERVTHVAISMGIDDFIHQGSKLEGKVDIHSLNPDSPKFNSYRKETFLFARRITTSSNDQ